MKQTITSIEEIGSIENNTVILEDRESFSMTRSEIRITGRNNILYCEPNVRLEGCNLHFDADNSLIYLSSSTHKYRANITVFNNCTCYIGDDCFFNGVINIICSEEKNVFIGRQALVGKDVWIRNADPHLVYSAETGERINPTKSVYIGDHVWIGQSSMILKGSRVHSGSIIGAGAVLAGKRVPSNTSFAGNPAKQIAEGIFWDEHVVHRWREKETRENQHYQGEESFIFEPADGETIPFGRIDNELKKRSGSNAKLEYVKKLADEDLMNRFAWKKTEPPMTLKRRIRLKIKNWLLRILK